MAVQSAASCFMSPSPKLERTGTLRSVSMTFTMVQADRCAQARFLAAETQKTKGDAMENDFFSAHEVFQNFERSYGVEDPDRAPGERGGLRCGGSARPCLAMCVDWRRAHECLGGAFRCGDGESGTSVSQRGMTNALCCAVLPSRTGLLSRFAWIPAFPTKGARGLEKRHRCA